MDGFRSGQPLDLSLVAQPAFSGSSDQYATVRDALEGGLLYRLEDVETLILSKSIAGLRPGWIEPTRQIVRDAAAERLGRLKFLAIDFAHGEEGDASRSNETQALVAEVANLIMRAPVVSIAYVRDYISGADLELALACSMIVCEEGARFSFAADPVVSVTTYALLAQRIGFVRAERLMEREEVLDAAQMRDLLLVKDTTEGGSGLEGLERFLRRTVRRHNSSYGIYRAQRIATPLIPEAFGDHAAL
jgi:enoyl-CoA hydratase/carnithine racemase